MKSRFYEGAIVERKKASVIDHTGIVVYEGLQERIIHSVPFRGIIVSSMNEFENGQSVVISKRYTPRLSADQVAARARSAIGQKWFLFFNCQHFVSWAAGLRPYSHDLNQAGLLAIGALLFIATRQ